MFLIEKKEETKQQQQMKPEKNSNKRRRAILYNLALFPFSLAHSCIIYSNLQREKTTNEKH